MSNTFALTQGTELAGEYRIERMLGAGGFGITYLATEPKLARLVTIKEYFPVDFAARNHEDDVVPRSQGSEADYKWGLQRFLEEARTLAKFNHPNICGVHRYFEARSTAYMVLHYEKGHSLKGWLKALGRHPRQQELDRILAPLLDALEVIHAADFLHRDIAPDNIIIREDGAPVLIDFGSARGEVAKHSKAVSALVKPGYSPYEQYATSGRQQGPWTDIYSLGATLYHAIAGQRPLEAPSRMVSDELKPVREVAQASYRPDFLKAIDHALALDFNERPRSVAEWRKALFAEPSAKGKRGPRREAGADAGPVGVPAPSAPLAAAGAAAAPAAAPTPSLIAAVAAAAQVPAERRGLLAAFHDGWRQAGGSADSPAPSIAIRAEPEPAVAAASVAMAPSAAAPAAPPPPRIPTSAPPRMPAGAQAVRRQSTIADDVRPAAPEVRKAPPRALAKAGGTRWRGIAVKLAIGAAIAAAAVAAQDRIPVVSKEGSGTVLSQTGEQVPYGVLRGHKGAVTGVAFTGDGRYIVSTAEDATVRVWSPTSRSVVRTWPLDAGAATSFAVEGRRALTGHRDGSVVVWDVEAAGKVATLRETGGLAAGAVAAAAFTVDPNVVAVTQGHHVLLWDLRGPSVTARLEGHEEPAQALAASSRRALASGSVDHTVKLWNLTDTSLTRTYRGHTDPVTALAFAPDGRRLASAAMDGRIRLSSTMTSRTHFTFRVQAGRVTALAFAPGADVLASAGEDGTLRLWDLKRGGRTARAYQSHTGAIQAIGYAPDGRTIAAAGADGLVRIWDATLPRPGT